MSKEKGNFQTNDDDMHYSDKVTIIWVGVFYFEYLNRFLIASVFFFFFSSLSLSPPRFCGFDAPPFGTTFKLLFYYYFLKIYFSFLWVMTSKILKNIYVNKNKKSPILFDGLREACHSPKR